MPNFREILGEDAVKFLSLPNGPMPMFPLLSLQEQSDVIEGRCIYRQYEHMPILDYMPAEYQRLNFGKLD